MDINKELRESKRDCSRGAPMGDNFGRVDHEEPAFLQRVHLDKQGYAPNGAYFGISDRGYHLYCLFDAMQTYRKYVRAVSRIQAFYQLEYLYGEIKLVRPILKVGAKGVQPCK